MALFPVAVAISRSDIPFFRIAASLPRSTIARGRPSTFPSALALARPLRTRLDIRSASNFATVARMPTMASLNAPKLSIHCS